MKVTKKIYGGYKEWETAKQKDINFSQLFGKYQYIYESEKGKVSLIEFKNYYTKGEDLWEIYSLEGDLFDDIERFDSKEEAEVRITELLETK